MNQPFANNVSLTGVNTSQKQVLIKGTVMQFEKALINDCLRVSKVSRKFRILAIHNFAVIYP